MPAPGFYFVIIISIVTYRRLNQLIALALATVPTYKIYTTPRS
jgi:hypothetical protein